MGTDIKKLKGYIKNHKKEEKEKEERKNRSSVEFYQNHVGKNCLYLCPPHENMEGIPFVMRGKHRNCGPEGKTDFMCISNDGKKLKQCPQCMEVKDLYDSSRDSSKKKAGKMKRNQRFYWQIIDMAPLLEDDPAEMPDCFLDFPDEEDTKTRKKRGCKACEWLDSCEGGIKGWSIGKKIQEPILDELEDLIDDEDVTNPKECRPVILRRKGEEAMNTEYSGIKFSKPFSFPKEVIARIQENLIDLSEMSVPKDADQIKKLMTGDTEEADDTDDGEDDVPKCFGKYDDDEDDCLKCDYSDPCEVEAEGENTKNSKTRDDDDNPKEEPEDIEGDDDSDDDDELENKLKAIAKKRQQERQKKAGKRTPSPKKSDDEDE